jgi:hypothetical protein
MSNHERAARLFEECEQLKMDGPSESMVAEAIFDAEEQAKDDIQNWLKKNGHAAAAEALAKHREFLLLEAFE